MKKELTALWTNIRARRRELNMTQAELARKSGVSRASIVLYESGRGHPAFDQVDAIVGALGGSFTVAWEGEVS